MINLVSDHIETEEEWLYLTNSGTTLPNGTNATQNIELSPLFFTRSGNSNVWSQLHENTGAEGRFWSSTPHTKTQGFFLQASASAVRPSFNVGVTHGLSLRCLVSTTNS